MAAWVLALGVMWLVVWLGWPLGRALAPLPPGTFALVESALPGLPAGVPSGAQSVPLLILEGDAVIRLGTVGNGVQRLAIGVGGRSEVIGGKVQIADGFVLLALPYRKARMS